MQVSVEVVLLSLGADGQVGYRVVTGPLPDGATPDAAALEVAGVGAAPAPGTVSHATSWRAPGPGRLVLTYALLPDPQPVGTTALSAPSIVCSPDPVRPTPPDLHTHHVVAHAARHLAYLAGTDPTVAAAAAKERELWTALCAAAASVPVAEHDSAHELGERRGRAAAHPAP